MKKGVDAGVQCVSWRRILYEPQPFDDNYVDPSFLKRFLNERRTFRTSYWYSTASTATTASQFILWVILVVAVWYRCAPDNLTSKENLVIVPRLDALNLMCLSVFSFFTGYIIHILITSENITTASHYILPNLSWILQRTFCVALVLLIFTPALKDLSASFSNDTIISLSIFMFCIHLLSCDFSFVIKNPFQNNESYKTLDGTTSFNQNTIHDQKTPTITFQPTSPLSLSAATCAAVLLASRLDMHAKVFGFLMFAMLVFSLTPLLVRDIRHYAPRLYFLIWLPCLTILVNSLLIGTQPRAALSFLTLLLVITFIIPAIFVIAQQFRIDMRGPWDIPTIDHQYTTY